MGSEGSSTLSAVISSMGAGALFVVFWLVLGVPLSWSIGAGIVGYGALWFMTAGLRSREKREVMFSEPFVDSKLAKKTTGQGLATANALRDIRVRLSPKDEIGNKLDRLADLVESIAKDVAADPKDAQSAALFLSYQGDAAVRIAKLAIDLDTRGASSEQRTSARSRVGTALDRLIDAHEKHLAHLQEDNLEELQAELEVLEQSLSLDDRMEKLT